MLIQRGLRSDVQVAKTVEMLKDGTFDKILPRSADGTLEVMSGSPKVSEQSRATTSTAKPAQTTKGI